MWSKIKPLKHLNFLNEEGNSVASYTAALVGNDTLLTKISLKTKEIHTPAIAYDILIN